jgi:hypothetical protein
MVLSLEVTTNGETLKESGWGICMQVVSLEEWYGLSGEEHRFKPLSKGLNLMGLALGENWYVCGYVYHKGDKCCEDCQDRFRCLTN